MLLPIFDDLASLGKIPPHVEPRHVWRPNKAEVESRSYAWEHVATATTCKPQQISMIRCVRSQCGSVGKYQIHCEEMIDEPPLRSNQPSLATAKRQSGKAHCVTRTAGYRIAMLVQAAVCLPQIESCFEHPSILLVVKSDTLHPADVNHDARPG